MNKKFLCVLLVCVMTLSSVFSIAGCKNDDPGKQGGVDTIEPGTVITDEELKTNIYNALSEAKLGGFTYSASANLSVKEGENEQAQKIVAEGTVLISNSEVQADVFSYAAGTDGEEEVKQYMLYFVRGDAVYSAQGGWNKEGEVRFSELKSRLKAEDPVVLGKETLGGAATEMLEMPAAVKIMKNIPALFDGVITKTEGGFSLKYDVMSAVGRLLEGVSALAGAIDGDGAMTFGGLFEQTFIKTTLEKLLKGVTAKEIVQLASNYLPNAVAEALPEAADNVTAIAYLENVLRSGAFYTALTGEEDAWSEFKTFSEVPLAKVIGIITGGEFSFEGMGLKDMVDDIKDGLAEDLVSMLLGMLELDDGELSDASFDLSLGFEFDDDKKLLGFSIDGLATGAKTVDAEEEEPGGKTAIRGTVKIEAAVASAPELFDLTGCKYYTENGGTGTIRAAE